jgi:hypothetical protein
MYDLRDARYSSSSLNEADEVNMYDLRDARYSSSSLNEADEVCMI